MRRVELEPVLQPDALKALEGQHLSSANVRETITENAHGVFEGKTKFLFLRRVLTPESHQDAFNNLNQIPGDSAKQSNRKAVRGAVGQEFHLGWLDHPEPRYSAKTLAYAPQYVNSWQLFSAVNQLFAACLPRTHAAQEAKAQGCRYHICNTAFSTVTCNRNVPTRVHRDSGNAQAGLTCLTTLGDFVGGDLCFPRFGISFQIAPGDLLIADTHTEYHGNVSSIFGTRLSCIFYFRESLLDQ